MAAKAKCWLWFRGGLSDGSSWKGGWFGTPSPLGGVRVENFDYVACRVPEWRVAWEEPKDLNEAPSIPENAQWKLFPTE